ncbi:hypothetical protein TNCT_647061 [Trichonephila clavata]|uniref:Uncharacterized protein n=1 Tax=Trichonephila clavata TaxID=2740835 RepID=A0A8X6K5M7_TRICU|nr:hypothetical protein TNCT_647061 [Trichonephila clavata]
MDHASGAKYMVKNEEVSDERDHAFETMYMVKNEETSDVQFAISKFEGIHSQKEINPLSRRLTKREKKELRQQRKDEKQKVKGNDYSDGILQQKNTTKWEQIDDNQPMNEEQNDNKPVNYLEDENNFNTDEDQTMDDLEEKPNNELGDENQDYYEAMETNAEQQTPMPGSNTNNPNSLLGKREYPLENVSPKKTRIAMVGKKYPKGSKVKYYDRFRRQIRHQQRLRGYVNLHQGTPTVMANAFEWDIRNYPRDNLKGRVKKI